MSDPNADSITERAKIACGTCGAPLSEHSPECSRHPYIIRPPVVRSGYAPVVLPAFSVAEKPVKPKMTWEWTYVGAETCNYGETHRKRKCECEWTRRRKSK